MRVLEKQPRSYGGVSALDYQAISPAPLMHSYHLSFQSGRLTSKGKCVFQY